jgi:hypothetical protein
VKKVSLILVGPTIYLLQMTQQSLKNLCETFTNWALLDAYRRLIGRQKKSYRTILEGACKYFLGCLAAIEAICQIQKRVNNSTVPV